MSFFLKAKSNFLNTKEQVILLLLCCILASFFFVPLVYNLWSIGDGFTEVSHYFFSTQFLSYLLNTIYLCIATSIGASFLGGTAAVLLYLNPGKLSRILEKAFYLPFAFPTYITAFIFAGAMSAGSDFKISMQALLGDWAIFLPRSDSYFLLYLAMSIVMSSYVFAAVKTGLHSVPDSLIEASKSLGAGRLQRFKKLYLPIVFGFWRQALVLICMECIADFGAVAVFNYDSLSIAIYRAWFGYFSLESASEISSVLILLLLLLSSFFKLRFLRNVEFSASLTGGLRPTQRTKCFVFVSYFALTLLLLLVLVLPVLQLFVWASEAEIEFSSLLVWLKNSSLLSFMASCLVLLFALFFLYLAKYNTSSFVKHMLSTVRLSYAIPGTVLAVGVFLPLSHLEHWVGSQFSISLGLIGSAAITVFALAIRFFNVFFGPMLSKFQLLNSHLEEAAFSLGASKNRIVGKIHFPILWPSIVPCFLLLWIDILKEMPIQLMTRAYSWDGLSVKIYEYTSEGEWEKAAFVSLVLIAFGFFSVFLMLRYQDGNKT